MTIFRCLSAIYLYAYQFIRKNWPNGKKTANDCNHFIHKHTLRDIHLHCCPQTPFCFLYLWLIVRYGIKKRSTHTHKKNHDTKP